MNKRDTKFISRIIVLSVTSLTFALAVRIVLESSELAKLVPRSQLRDIMLFVAPLASLMATQFLLAVKSFGMRSLATEGLVFIFIASIFLAMTLSYFLGGVTEVPAENCSWWRLFGCPGESVRKESFLWAALVFLLGLAALISAAFRENLFQRRQ